MLGLVAIYFNDYMFNEKDVWKIQFEDMGQMVMDLLNMYLCILFSKVEVWLMKLFKK